MKPAVAIDPPDWMTAPSTEAVIAALQAEGATVRFVGGCVRNALLEQDVRDIDLATPDSPEQVTVLLEAAGIKAVPTGIGHGTITAVHDGNHFEVTTLRRDVETDGRHAVVEFTDDWEADAARRDFTINALYADANGTVYDPADGLPDLKAGRLRFVGDPKQRIEEDALRVLRFFRLFAHYGRTQPDADSLAACADMAESVRSLSAERVTGELFRLLSAPDALAALTMMASAGVLQQILPEATQLETLAILQEIETSAALEPDPLLRLAAIVGGTPDKGADIAAGIADRLRMSGAERRRLALLLAPPVVVHPGMSDQDMHVALYQVGRSAFADLVWLAWSRAGPGTSFMNHVKVAAAWDIPSFPLSGDDVKDLGVGEGPDVGELLQDVEVWWMSGDFAADRRACLRKLRDLERQRAASAKTS